jgi:microcompartment protein CcmK/EutM
VVGANKFAPLVGGDTGEETPHRVGVELLRRVIASRGDVTAVEKYVPLSGISNAVDEEACPEGYNVPDNASLDVVGYNNGEVVVVGEVESARSRKEAEKQGLDDTRVGLKDYESVRKDYALMEAFPKAESVWAFRNRDIAHTALRALSSLDGGCVDEEMAELWEEQRPEIEPFSENTLPDDTQYGMNRLETFISLRDAVSESG